MPTIHQSMPPPLPSRSDTADYGQPARLPFIERLAPFTVRETKDTAGIQLPEKTDDHAHFVDLPAWQMAKYTAYRDELAYEYEHRWRR